MGQELIYTSVPRGLKPGSRGFCTVVSTEGMSANLVQRLESLSGYRHVFGPQDANARRNPVVFSHLLVVVSGRPYHVLSRVADAGLDYTQRTNKLAHHVVLDVAERVPGGPAWLLGQPGFLQTTFDGQPRVLPAGRKPPAGNETPGECRHWAQIAGNAGWGGALAEATALGQKAYLVFRPGMEMLPLLAESLALLPPEKRWGITFSTYLTGLPPGVDCQLACVVQGSPEHARLRQTPNVLVIDLCRPLGPPPESAYAHAARSGDVSLLAGSASQAVAEYPSSQAASAPAAAIVGSQSRGAPGGSPPPLAVSASLPGAQPGPALQRRTFRRKEAPKWPTYALLTGVPLLIFASVAALWLASRGGTDLAGNGDKPAVTARQRNRPVDKPDEQPEEHAHAPEEPPAETDDEPTPDDPVVEPKEPVDPPTPEESAQPPAGNGITAPPEPTVAPPTEGHPSEESAEQPDPKDAVSEPEGTTDPRPTLSYAVGIVPEDAKADEDGWFAVSGPKLSQKGDKLTLSLVGPDKEFLRDAILDPEAPSFSVAGRDVGALLWHLTAKNFELATLELRDRQLRLKWAEKLPGLRFDPRSLRNCVLVVTKEGSEQPMAQIALRMPITTEKVPVVGFLDRKAVTLPVQLTDLPDPLLQQLRWEFVPGTVGGSNDLPQVTVDESSDPDSVSVFSMTILDKESIKVSVSPGAVAVTTTGLQLSYTQRLDNVPSITPPWKVQRQPDFDKRQIGRLRDKAEQDATKLIRTFEANYLPEKKRLEDPEKELKRCEGLLNNEERNLKDLQAQLNAAQEAKPDKVKGLRERIDESRQSIGTLKTIVQDLRQIVQYRSYQARMDGLDRGLDGLQRVYVGYRVYLDHTEDHHILLIEGLNQPSDARPGGELKQLPVTDLLDGVEGTPATHADDGTSNPSSANADTGRKEPAGDNLLDVAK